MLSLVVSDFNILLLNVLTALPEDFSVLEAPKNSPSTLTPTSSSAVLNLELREGSASRSDKAGSRLSPPARSTATAAMCCCHTAGKSKGQLVPLFLSKQFPFSSALASASRAGARELVESPVAQPGQNVRRGQWCTKASYFLCPPHATVSVPHRTKASGCLQAALCARPASLCLCLHVLVLCCSPLLGALFAVHPGVHSYLGCPRLVLSVACTKGPFHRMPPGPWWFLQSQMSVMELSPMFCLFCS